MVDGSSFLSGQVQTVEISELLAILPPRAEVDKLINQFFDHKTFPIPVARKCTSATILRLSKAHSIASYHTHAHFHARGIYLAIT